MGTLLHRKVYSPSEYLYMSLVGVGVALFGSNSSHKVGAGWAGIELGVGSG